MRVGTLFLFITSFFVFGVTGDPSSFIFFYVYALLGMSIILSFAKKTKAESIGVFFNVYSIYSLFSLFHYCETSYYWCYVPDEIGSFIPIAKLFMNSTSLGEVFSNCFSSIYHIKDPGYYFYISSIAYISNKYLGGYSDMPLFLGTVVWGAGCAVLLFQMLKQFLSLQKAKKLTYVFMFLSLFNLYSLLILRDVHIAFFFLVAFLVLLRPFSIKGVLILIISSIVVYYLRASYGLFYIIFILYYLYSRFKKVSFIYIMVLVIVGLSLRFFIQDSYEFVSGSVESYSASTIEKADVVAESLGAKLLHLPSPIKEISQIFYSQISPFPSWLGLVKASNIYSAFLNFFPIINSFFWSVIFFCLLYWVLTKKMKGIPDKIIHLSVLSFVLILFNTANMSERRIMCVYPLLFTLFCYVTTRLKTQIVWNTIRNSSFVYLGLCVVYLILKF